MKNIIFILGILLTTNIFSDQIVDDMVNDMKKLLPIKIGDSLTLTRIENSDNHISNYLIVDGKIKNRIKFTDGMEEIMLKSECTDPFKRVLMHDRKLVYEYKYYDKEHTLLGSNYFYENKCVQNNYPWDEFYTHEVSKYDKEFNINNNGIKSERAYECKVQSEVFTLRLKKDIVHMSSGDRYWKYILTSQKDTYANPKDDNYRLRIDGNNIYFLNGIKQTFVECKIKEGKN